MTNDPKGNLALFKAAMRILAEAECDHLIGTLQGQGAVDEHTCALYQTAPDYAFKFCPNCGIRLRRQ